VESAPTTGEAGPSEASDAPTDRSGPASTPAGPPVRRFEYRGHELAYEVHGEGPRVTVLLHGVLLDASLNRGLAQSLAAHGHRVVLLELLGHGRSDRPVHATEHRVDRYADQVVALLDHLGVEQAVVGGTSLGANVALQAANTYPDRVRGMLIEMPVLEWAAPAAGIVFIPLLVGVRFGGIVARLTTRGARRLPRTGYGAIDTFMNAASMEPREIAAVLHGLLVGPIAPPIDERREMDVPTLIIAHQHDALHPFNDATNLAEQLPGAELTRARSAFELRLRPTRLTATIAAFLDRVWQPRVAGTAAEG
jgi:pimeloyl-ACP methyl ester carboxylesterase